MKTDLIEKWSPVLDKFNINYGYRNVCSLDLERQIICNRNNILHQLYHNFSDWFAPVISSYYEYLSTYNQPDKFEFGYMYFEYPIWLNDIHIIQDDYNKLYHSYFDTIYKRLIDNKIHNIQFNMGFNGLYVLYY